MQVRRAHGEAEVAQALALRERVFCGEQGVSVEADRDGLDGEALHVVAVDEGQVVGTCRLLVERGVARLGRMAVERPLRGRGVGRAVLEEAERTARAEGAAAITLNAQAEVSALYAAAGFVAYGEPFVEEGIDHIRMEKRLD